MMYDVLFLPVMTSCLMRCLFFLQLQLTMSATMTCVSLFTIQLKEATTSKTNNNIGRHSKVPGVVEESLGREGNAGQ